MDPTHHEKIVDKLMQYRGKIPKPGHLSDKKAEWTCDDLRNHIDYLIQNIELFAVTFEKGLIR
jgi:ABC-type protease/lipase transport system fused ATPase/permease subunit